MTYQEPNSPPLKRNHAINSDINILKVTMMEIGKAEEIVYGFYTVPKYQMFIVYLPMLQKPIVHGSSLECLV